jgi:hypothetical protein
LKAKVRTSKGSFNWTAGTEQYLKKQGYEGTLELARMGPVYGKAVERVAAAKQIQQEFQDGAEAAWEEKLNEDHPEENPAGPTFAQAMLMARQAGARIGDTDGFEGWLHRSKLDSRGPQVRQRLEREFLRGVETGGTVSRPAPAAKGIWKDTEGWRVTSDPDSLFDGYEDAKRFVDAQRNPHDGPPRFVPAEDDWPLGPIKWTVIDTHTGRKVTTDKMWVRKSTRAAAEKEADKMNRQYAAFLKQHPDWERRVAS